MKIIGIGRIGWLTGQGDLEPKASISDSIYFESEKIVLFEYAIPVIIIPGIGKVKRRLGLFDVRKFVDNGSIGLRADLRTIGATDRRDKNRKRKKRKISHGVRLKDTQ